jgi:hypothetical protein
MPGYKPEQHGLIRDKIYPSEIAAQRPAFVTRIHCSVPYDEERETREDTVRGDQGYREYPIRTPQAPGPHNGDITEDRVALFNRQLRGE